ncbi:3-isopropylmalate dehydratase large subunit [Peribacillus frigoritolerans]|jgi:3-isopropylmalate/(R)-2-methylmalate dehydratase large subunit|uniref:3-isopropylmalate dehydratase large subunit n=1 Tax=Peribacillus castrilensis TaxID=2897690 RepID=A0AAW9NC71_9BACI|nr:3-isopropylmalate dehydratase large subunit [Peribacillus frigoritolerans]MBD8134813.1 3-isopropylmalate dehydratase large subunit [Bacillus sp. CFBP 13597]MEC0272362.1 3-isopropylmalate dehydratase large subunit [Peribacillus castrilensis]MDF2000124.1 3-isopropylmalate dehydratase large subunit [Peribacillus frigoritolerans]MEC0299093.1 3-isopropylmalate dehydratase large subunit [Peribacillus castrilensis]MEC0345910.1 3-isopropylmalate dehydratase large subunit [Peribacillus castrilensis]
MGKSIIEKIWDRHIVNEEENKPDLIYIDLQYIHEVTSPQAFEGLRLKGRKVRRPDRTFATMDHNVPTVNRYFIEDDIARKQLEALEQNCKEFGIRLADLDSPDQGIVHVIGPELGLTQPGMTIVCGDSHTSTHGAFGSIAFGIGTSEVEHVLATQTLWQTKPKTLKLEVNGKLGHGVMAKDVILYVISKFGVDFGTGHIIEYCGEVFRDMSMEERMTVCNMSIEGGARAGLVAPDETTFSYLKGRKYLPKGEEFEQCVQDWKSLSSDEDAVYDQEIILDGSLISPMVSWGTNPGMASGVDGKVPTFAEDIMDPKELNRAIEYMGLEEGMPITEIPVQHVFIGSCTNSRIEDLRQAAEMIDGQTVQKGVRAMVVPGSQSVKRQAEDEGLDEIFKSAGFEWRESGCSMCLSMNPDVVPAGEHCASTSNRNFEGRQGAGARTHLVSPAMAAAAAIHGKFVDIRNLKRTEQVQ